MLPLDQWIARQVGMRRFFSLSVDFIGYSSTGKWQETGSGAWKLQKH